MSPAFYHIAHLVGLIFIFVGFGALLAVDGYKRAMKWIVLGLVISLVTGFGNLAKLGIMANMPKWVWVKIGLWLVLGFLPVLVKRQVLPARAVVYIAIVIGACVAYLGHLKPF